MGTLFYVWEQSRTNNPVPMPRDIELVLDYEGPDFVHESNPLAKICRMLGEHPGSKGEYNISATKARVQEVIDQIIDEDIPCTENLNFVFAIDNMSISLREQMVRHRIGVTIGDRLGVDMIPEASKSSFWSQTMRMLPMDHFHSEGRYILPEGLQDKVVKLNKFHLPTTARNIEHVSEMPAEDFYVELMAQIEFAYNKLIEAGVAMEDARQIIPIGVSHSITWSVNLKALMHILGKRACWVAQANLWEALISGMVNELCEQVSPKLRKIIQPPCFKKGKYKACPYFQINKERVQGRDHMPPCPLYVYHDTEASIEAANSSVQDTGNPPTWLPAVNLPVEDIRNWTTNEWSTTGEVERRMLNENIERFERLWKLNVLTGEPLKAAVAPSSEEDDAHMYEGFQS